MFENAGTLYELQRNLSVAQASPILGPLIVSPAKALVSVAEIIIGIAIAVLFGVFSLLFILFHQNDALSWTATQTAYGLGNVGLGVTSLIYSVANMGTLGLFGYAVENLYYAGAPSSSSPG
jgi:hypothetical protein